MGNNKWMYYVAYAVLVVGAILALVFSERPLSATVVTLALFSFNTAAIVLITPAIMNFLSRMKDKSDQVEADVMLQLKEIKARVLILANATNKGLSLKNTLEKTASENDSSENMSHGHTNTQSASSSYSQAALNSVQNAAVLPSTGSSSGIQTPAPKPLTNSLNNSLNNGLSSLDNIFNTTRAQVIQKPALPVQNIQKPASAPSTPEQASLFPSHTEASPTPQAAPEAVQEATPAPARYRADVSIVVKAHVEEDDVLCLRGEGPGLNWQEGMPMNYTGNDEWRWSAQEITQPITCRIYLNDEISAFGDDIVLQPGETLEVAPTFPKVDA